MDAEAKRRLLATIGIGLGVFIIALDWTIVNTALPAIQRELSASLGELQWVMNLFGLCMTSLLVMMGRFADAYGRKKIFQIGVVVFGVASLFAGLSPSPVYLIVWRGVQGCAAAILLTTSQALMSHAYPKELRGKAIGIWAAIGGAGLALGAALGGIITGFLPWGYIFYLNIPFAIMTFWIVKKAVLESKHPSGHTQMDWLGLIILFLTLVCWIFAIIQGPEIGWGSPLIVGLFVLGGIFLSFFIFVEKRAEFPVIDFALFKNHRFFAGSIANFCCLGFNWGSFFLVSIYLQNLKNYPPLSAGLILLAMTVPFVLVSTLIGHHHHRIRPKTFILTGFLFLMVSALMQTSFGANSSLTTILTALIFFGAGWGIAFGPASTAALDSLPRDLAGVASGGLTTVQEMGGTLGLAITGALFRNVEAKTLLGLLDQVKLNTSTVNLHLLRSKIADPVTFQENADRLGLHTKVYPLFQKAFSDGFQSALWFPFALSLLGFLVVLFVMPKKEKIEIKH